MKIGAIYIYTPRENSSVTIYTGLLILSIATVIHQIQSIFSVFYLDCNHQFFYRHYLYCLNIQRKLLGQ